MRRPAALLIAAVALSLGSCSAVFQGSAPQRNGTLEVPGLAAPVEIVRDGYGIPHISARSDHDLFFAQGFVHAQDRLFQMDTERRVARGELAEAFGPSALPADRLFRHLGFAARAPALFASWPKRSREIVRAYCDGANAAMDALSNWPAEFRIARYAPRRFTPEDVAAVSLLKSFGLAQWAEEVTLYRIAGRLPREKVEELMPRVPPDSPVVVPGTGPAAAARCFNSQIRLHSSAAASAPAKYALLAPYSTVRLSRAPKQGAAHRRSRCDTVFMNWSTKATDPVLLREGLASLRAVLGDLPRSGGSNAWVVSGRPALPPPRVRRARAGAVRLLAEAEPRDREGVLRRRQRGDGR
ncbi:MAG: penicillin acylase family protein, partial [Deltaproteobacteria bacterium]|nr:penicillin acylase family protein [Deltaproteobacteria bacterium]